MPIKNITIENSSFVSDKGFVAIEAENITLKNVSLQNKTSKVMQIQNSKNITLDNITYPAGKTDLLEINGERTSKIRLINTDTKSVKNKVIYTNKATKKSFIEK